MLTLLALSTVFVLLLASDGRTCWIHRHGHETRQHWLQRAERHYAYVTRYGHGRPQRSHARALRFVRRELAAIARTALYVPPAIRQAFLCIHGGEGAWDDPGAPYYGGLQMDWSFMASYGGALLQRKGTADHWTPAEQIHVAYIAYRSGRGFYPWPQTAANCGLI